MTADNPAARADLDALARTIYEASDEYAEEGVAWEDQHGSPRREALTQARSVIADRLAPLLAERDAARAERDRLRERVEAVADEPYYGAVMSNERYAEGFHDGWRIAMDHLRAALADPEAS